MASPASDVCCGPLWIACLLAALCDGPGPLVTLKESGAYLKAACAPRISQIKPFPPHSKPASLPLYLWSGWSPRGDDHSCLRTFLPGINFFFQIHVCHFIGIYFPTTVNDSHLKIHLILKPFGFLYSSLSQRKQKKNKARLNMRRQVQFHMVGRSLCQNNSLDLVMIGFHCIF